MADEHTYGRLKQILQQQTEGEIHDGLLTSPLSNDSSGALPSMPSEDEQQMSARLGGRAPAATSPATARTVDPVGGTPERGQPAPAHAHAAPGGCRKCLELYEVLKEASVEIKRERSYNQQLREEMGIMATQLAEFQTSQADVAAQEAVVAQLAQENEALQTQLAAYKAKVVELSLTSAFAVEQLAVLQARAVTAQQQQQQQQQWAGTFAATATHLQQQQQQATLDSQQAQAHPYPHPYPHAPLDAPNANPLEVHPAAGAQENPTAPQQPPRTSPTRISPSRAASAGRKGREGSTKRGGGTRPRSVSPAQHYAQRSDMLLDRMRRALAPPPKETMGLLVQSMVQELRRVMRSRGTELPLERKGDCLYTLGPKKLNLAVNGGKLVVRTGGGCVDFLEYLEKYLSSAAARPTTQQQQHPGRRGYAAA